MKPKFAHSVSILKFTDDPQCLRGTEHDGGRADGKSYLQVSFMPFVQRVHKKTFKVPPLSPQPGTPSSYDLLPKLTKMACCTE